MANTISCEACEEIRQNDPSFVVNGLGDTECASLQNNTGLSPSSGNDDCEDLNNLNDCLVGNMATEVDAYDVCDWKTFMKKFIPNVWTTLKGIICAICGLWKLAQRIDCILNYMGEGATFAFSEFTDTGASYIVAGRGTSFANVSASGTAGDLYLIYVAGGMGYLGGSLMFYTDDFTDAKAVANYDNHGVNPTTSASRKGNAKWGQTGYLGAGGELLYEIRLKREQFPQIGRFFAGHVGQSSGYAFTGEIRPFGEGQYAFGQSGWCDTTTGAPITADSDAGHRVPAGWVYIQARMKSADGILGSSGGMQHTPYGIIPMRINQEAIEC